MMKAFWINYKSTHGFTLAELAIVMIIVGLLVGGILKGQDLIAGSRVASTISAIKKFDTAINTFRKKYDAMPGDMPHPQGKLVNCASAPCNIGGSGGNGNGRIDTNVTGFAAAPLVEHQMAFVQLAAADIIDNVNPNLGAVWGGVYPPAEIGGGFHIAYIDAAGDLPGSTVAAANVRAGHYLALHNSVNDAVDQAGIITPSEAFRIDNKRDDGHPSMGDVINGGAANCINAGAYQENVEQKVCNLFIRIQQ